MATKTAKEQGTLQRLFPKWEVKERIYILTGKHTPITFQLRSRHTGHNALEYFDPVEKYPRALRYVTNQSTIFEDEQEGNVVLGEVVFEDGKITVPARNTLLQQFLALHPDNVKNGGVRFEEFDPEVVARERIEKVNKGFEAVAAAMAMDIGSLEAVARIKFPSRVDNMTTSEIKYDVIQFAQANPDEFHNLANNSNIKMINLATKAIKLGVIKIKDDNVSVCWRANGKLIKQLPFSAKPIETLAVWLKTDEGIPVMESIVDKMS